MPLSLIVALALVGGQAQRPAATLPDALGIQVMLDRAGFSPGVLDGHVGRNTERALAAFQSQGGDAAAVPADVLTRYVITEQDATAEYSPDIPGDLVEQSNLPALNYRDIVEALAERFHSTPALLRSLNPGAAFTAGEQITVPNVQPLVAPIERVEFSSAESVRPTGTSGGSAKEAHQAAILARPDVVVTVSQSASALTVADASGKLIMYAPVTIGSMHDPLPIGEWKVNAILLNPTFRYNPDLFWDADPTHTKAIIKPGPNNPVGLVWIDLSKEHYGIHGTPEPEAIGRSQSHGCVRLTNWDALKLAGLVKPGTQVIFMD
jgi:lipoprotein-anchoring transpeptidase ErfK/SrfK